MIQVLLALFLEVRPDLAHTLMEIMEKSDLNAYTFSRTGTLHISQIYCTIVLEVHVSSA